MSVFILFLFFVLLTETIKCLINNYQFTKKTHTLFIPGSFESYSSELIIKRYYDYNID